MIRNPGIDLYNLEWLGSASNGLYPSEVFDSDQTSKFTVPVDSEEMWIDIDLRVVYQIAGKFPGGKHILRI